MSSTDLGSAPIGVFDSGIGGLSVLRALLQRLPQERFVYVADTGHAPYGEKSIAAITERSQRITHFLRDACACKALVIACNTATAVAAHTLRQAHAGWPIIGIEPAIKPAAALTRTGAVGVLATQGTLSSPKYRELRSRVVASVNAADDAPALAVHDVACNGLASAIEALVDAANGPVAEQRVQALLHQYLGQLGHCGAEPGQVDTVVLGCTHYPLIADRIQALLPPQVTLLDPGDRVALHTLNVLHALGQLSPRSAVSSAHQAVHLWTSGDPDRVSQAAQHWMHMAPLPAHPLPC
ncbi:glutamate racemase [Comamonas serinivorans]|uniref:Glutamate racemase n=1 Tax=Comamonas serinivorans TaxID=1082851 RepID=A0A1Y0ETE9_9BURK|nr:glutamate racemase [Comamonas serinivorans]ARU06808.1 glutamate racemase [Comamonas serinivorans]